MKFTATISRFEDSEIHWTSIIVIPEEIFQEMIKIAPSKRIICTLNNTLVFHCAMIPRKNYHFIMLGKDKIKTLNLDPNEEFQVEIVPDDSEFGADISKEFQEVLKSDPDGKMLFDKLTLGKQRSIIYVISKSKSSQLKIEKTFVFLDHLKRNKGKFDPIIYQEDYRIFRLKNSI